MAGNQNLNSAKSARKDEFYTQLTDIEKEMRYYRKHFKDKVVFFQILCFEFQSSWFEEIDRHLLCYFSDHGKSVEISYG